MLGSIQFVAANIHSLLFPGNRNGVENSGVRNRRTRAADSIRGMRNGRNFLR
jgi:hypothetical protein